MLVHELTKNTANKRPMKRIGRGNGSWKWNYSTKWLKGQLARSWGWMPAWFEWGQTPLTQRLPKLRGFKRPAEMMTVYSVVNLGDLQTSEKISDTTTVTKEILVQAGLIKNSTVSVKILSNWEFSKKLTFSGIEKFSKSAAQRIQDVGWTIA